VGVADVEQAPRLDDCRFELAVGPDDQILDLAGLLAVRAVDVLVEQLLGGPAVCGSSRAQLTMSILSPPLVVYA
jgi:hypothetical protein